LRQASGNHEGQEETSRDPRIGRARYRRRAAIPNTRDDGTRAATQRSHGEQRGRARSSAPPERCIDVIKVLIVAEHDGDMLSPATARCVSCARALQPEVLEVAVLGDEPTAV